VAVAERGIPNDFTDDQITVFTSKPDPILPPPATIYTAQAPIAATGDPNALLLGREQPVCANAGDPTNPILRFDSTARAASSPRSSSGTSTIDVYLVSNRNLSDSTKSALVHSHRHPAPLPVLGPSGRRRSWPTSTTTASRT
jgi:hypothetical protein